MVDTQGFNATQDLFATPSLQGKLPEHLGCNIRDDNYILLPLTWRTIKVNSIINITFCRNLQKNALLSLPWHMKCIDVEIFSLRCLRDNPLPVNIMYLDPSSNLDLLTCPQRKCSISKGSLCMLQLNRPHQVNHHHQDIYCMNAISPSTRRTAWQSDLSIFLGKLYENTIIPRIRDWACIVSTAPSWEMRVG